MINWIRKVFSGNGAAAMLPLTPAQAERLAAWQKREKIDFSQPHFRTRYVVVDVEASGLNMRHDRLISIGAIAVSENAINVNDAFEVVLRQDTVSSHENILIHGIGGSAQREGIDPAEALLAFLEYIDHAPLVAYHAQFDEAMIGRALRDVFGLKISLPWIDLAWVMPELFRKEISEQVPLDNWLALFGIENIQRHNAVSDAYATAKLLLAGLVRGVTQGKDSAAAFIETEKARRWIRRGM